MKADPLEKALVLAQEAEEQASLQLKTAQFEWQKQQEQLGALQQYRLDYMKQMESQQGKSISASGYHQFHQFVKQIDEAIARQLEAVSETHSMKQHRQTHWLTCQQKHQAVGILLNNKAKKAQQQAMRLEQKMTDEFAMQQFYRKSL
ncbi:flagellar export protein FliJ [Shewanella surugensis]|uniref:Flagellar FliJ protein n=1 Tax=Shewanella surugensis TaxID=212020 RepID=A0ABT0L9H3_9GAMM|nr:flagellar export protein FliJ [Shewanella surugensis]MCL1124367.1 flagellar export protein FliJ [Shewanella surugensis]